MPHQGLNWFRLKEHFRKCFVFYIVGIAIVLVLTSLLYTTTTPQVPDDREVLVYLVDLYSDTAPLEPLEEKALEYGKTVDETLESVHFESILYNDPEQDYTSAYLLMARMTIGDGDAYFAVEYALPALLNSGCYYPLDDLIAEDWLNGWGLEPYYYTDEETGETHVAALKLDNVNQLGELGAFANKGAYLIIAANGRNIDTTAKTVEFMINSLMEDSYATTAESAD